MDKRADFAERFNAAFKASGLSQEELERRSGVSQATISLIQRGKTDPKISTVMKLATALPELIR